MATRKRPSIDLVVTPLQPGPDLHAPPSGIGALALAWYAEIMKTYSITDIDGRLTLHNLIRSFDRAETCAELIREQGSVLVGRDGQAKIHPLIAAERDARAQVLQALKHLDVGIGEPVRTGRPAGPGR